MFNSWLPESKDRLPLTWWKQHPVYLAANVGTAYAFIRYEKGELKLPKIPKVVFTPSAKTRSNKPSTGKSPSVDDILDKISRHGMQSLTAEERRTLDKASDEMKRRAR